MSQSAERVKTTDWVVMMTENHFTHIHNQARLAALQRTALLDTPAEAAFDRLARLARRMLQAPVALVTLLADDRQFFKSCIGLPEPWASRRETPLTHSFCQYEVASNQPLIVEDARTHSFLRDNPAIVDLAVIAYLGMPLISSDGYVLGSFCVIDSRPHAWSADDVEMVADLAAAVMTEIELRTTSAELRRTHEELERRVRERTTELARANAALQAELIDLIQMMGPLEGRNTPDTACLLSASDLVRQSLVPAEREDSNLSEREIDVMRLLAQGYSIKEIAARLAVSTKTIETYKVRAMSKLRLTSRVALVQHALRSGWLQPE